MPIKAKSNLWFCVKIKFYTLRRTCIFHFNAITDFVLLWLATEWRACIIIEHSNNVFLGRNLNSFASLWIGFHIIFFKKMLKKTCSEGWGLQFGIRRLISIIYPTFIYTTLTKETYGFFRYFYFLSAIIIELIKPMPVNWHTVQLLLLWLSIYCYTWFLLLKQIKLISVWLIKAYFLSYFWSATCYMRRGNWLGEKGYSLKFKSSMKRVMRLKLNTSLIHWLISASNKVAHIYKAP